MRKIFLLSFFLAILSVTYAPYAIVYADDLEVTEPCNDASIGNKILPCTTVQTKDPKTGSTTSLPTANAKYVVLPQAIKIVLAIVGSASVIVFVYAGVMLVVSQGNEEQMTKFKNVLVYSIIGLILVTTSYGLVRGILQLVFK